MLRTGELRIRQVREDTLIPGHVVERADQYYRGVRVHGADISRQLDEHGVVQSVFGNLHDGIDLRTDPALTRDAARARVVKLAGADQPNRTSPSSWCCRRTTDASAWRGGCARSHPRSISSSSFLDAASGDVLLRISDRQSQSAVGRAAGVLGDNKKISVTGSGGSFTARDLLRPPVIETEDMKGDPIRTVDYLNGFITLDPSDLATNPDNNWTDVAVDDAHVYAGYTYDYYFKRFGRRGLDDNNIRIRSLANPVRRTPEDLDLYFNAFSDFFVNAFYAGGGVMVMRRRPAGWLHLRRPGVELPLGRARRRGARADPRRHRVHLEPDLPERVGRAERGVLRHHGHQRRVLLSAGRQRSAARRTTVWART